MVYLQYTLPFLSILYYSSAFLFYNDTATTKIYTLSLHDALPISLNTLNQLGLTGEIDRFTTTLGTAADRKSTRLNSSHPSISYAVFCLKKKKTKMTNTKLNNYRENADKRIINHRYRRPD